MVVTLGRQRMWLTKSLVALKERRLVNTTTFFCQRTPLAEFGIEPDIKADMLQEDELRGKDTLIEMARKLLSE